MHRMPLIAALFGVAYLVVTLYLSAGGGLTLTVYQGTGDERRILAERMTSTVDSSVFTDDPTLPRRHFSAVWRGVWHVPVSGFYDIYATADDRVSVRMDGELVQHHSVVRPASGPRTILLEAGFHELHVDYEQLGGMSSVRLAWATPGGSPRPLPADQLVPRPPRFPRVRQALHAFRESLRLAGVVALAVGAWIGLLWLWRRLAAPHLMPLPSGTRRRACRAVMVTLVGLVVVYGAALRFDALTLKYGPVERPGWLRAVQEGRGPDSLLRPAAVTWSPVGLYPHRDGPPSRYRSDPYTYLEYAREMDSFYGAHRREPLFPFLTKLFLGLLHDQDVAVSVASASVAVVAILATFAVGAVAFSYWVGVGAALALAIEYDVISWGVEGWRDDAFTLAVVLSAWTMLRFLQRPSRERAIAMGIVGGLACLVRITSLSYLVPGFAYLLLALNQPWKERVQRVGFASLVMMIIVAPFMINCWREFGDPFYAINVHADVYRQTEGRGMEASQGVAGYLEDMIRHRPVRTLDTLVLGMTAYPFQNKWSGFDPWSPVLGPLLSWAALLGLTMWIGSRSGRLLLVVLATSLVPYAFTWRLIADWRFTEHAYPFLLVASFLAIVRVVTWAARVPSLRWRVPVREAWASVAAWLLVVVGIGVGAWTATRVLPWWVAHESLADDDAVTITAGDRDASFFGEGWSRPLRSGGVPRRVAAGPLADVWLPLPGVQDYDITIRLDPFPTPIAGVVSPLPAVRAFLNGRPLARLSLGWNPERVGAHDVALPRSLVQPGMNRLALVIQPGAVREPSPSDLHVASHRPSRVALWYVRIRPGGAGERSSE